MIINIRGTNGSGKSTVMIEIMRVSVSCLPKYGALGVQRPEAYYCHFEGVDAPVFTIGPYLTPTGGCDAVHPFSVILSLLDKYASKGHVLFEGSLVSDHYGKVGKWLEDRQTVASDVSVVFLTTPLDVCLERVRGRREGRGDARELNVKNTTSRHHSICGVRTKMLNKGKLRVHDLDQDEAPRRILAGLRSGGLDG